MSIVTRQGHTRRHPGRAATDVELTHVRQQNYAENAMSMDEQAASLTTGTARSERDMLVAIQNG